jgi:hypothetical protein
MAVKRRNENNHLTDMIRGLTRLELCHMLLSALSLTASQVKSLPEIELDEMPIAKAILIKSLIKSYQQSDFSLPMMIFTKIFGHSEDWGQEYTQALKAARDVPIPQQISNLKNVIQQLEARGAIEKLKT